MSVAVIAAVSPASFEREWGNPLHGPSSRCGGEKGSLTNKVEDERIVIFRNPQAGPGMAGEDSGE
jgi:hypothetical protein